MLSGQCLAAFEDGGASTADEEKTRPEALLLLCCARTHLDPETIKDAKALTQESLDWDYLLKTALHHKVMPLLYWQLKTNLCEFVPADFMERLRDHFYLNAARNHLLTQELNDVLELFKESGIRAVPYKGPVLAAGVYNDVALRQFSDLDIFIRREDVAKASPLLLRRGYRKEQELTSAQESAFLKTGCEHMFIREADRVFLELHWGFAPTYFPLKLDAESMWRRLIPIHIGDTHAHTFAPEDLLLILSVNAGKEFWKDLSRLCDINELIRASPQLDWERITRNAISAGARRMLFVSTLLAHDLLQAPVPPEIIRHMAEARGVRRLALMGKRELFREGKSLASVSGILKPAKALDGPLDQLRFHLRSALTPTPEDWSFINLPERLGFLYYLTRPLRLVKKYVLRRRNDS